MKYVPKENVYVVLFEQYTKNIENETKKTLSFIGADVNVEIDYNIKENTDNGVTKGENTYE